MDKHLVKQGRKIKGFVYQSNGQWWYAYGTPSQQGGYIAFACKDLESGIANVEMPMFNR